MDTFRWDNVLKQELWDALHDARELGIISEDKLSYLWAYQDEGMRWLNPKPSICDNAPYPECNGAQGCFSCRYQV